LQAETIVQKDTGRCLEEDGEFVVLGDCTGSPSQAWILKTIAWK